MCGIAGAVGYSLGVREKAALTTLMFLSELRGKHSTGVTAASVTTGGERTFHMAKAAQPSSAFIENKQYKNIMDLGATEAFMGHCRHATLGTVNKANAHPWFIEGEESSIIGCHNGTVHSYAPAKKDEDKLTDSLNLLTAIADEGVEKALSTTSSYDAYALTWMDVNEGVFNIIRNNERTLFYTLVTMHGNQKTMFYASEREFLQLALGRKMLTHTPIKPFDPYKLYTWDIGENAADFKEERVAEPSRVYTYPEDAYRGWQDDWMCREIKQPSSTSKKGEDKSEKKEAGSSNVTNFQKNAPGLTYFTPSKPHAAGNGTKTYKFANGIKFFFAKDGFKSVSLPSIATLNKSQQLEPEKHTFHLAYRGFGDHIWSLDDPDLWNILKNGNLVSSETSRPTDSLMWVDKDAFLGAGDLSDDNIKVWVEEVYDEKDDWRLGELVYVNTHDLTQHTEKDSEQ